MRVEPGFFFSFLAFLRVVAPRGSLLLMMDLLLLMDLLPLLRLRLRLRLRNPATEE